MGRIYLAVGDLLVEELGISKKTFFGVMSPPQMNQRIMLNHFVRIIESVQSEGSWNIYRLKRLMGIIICTVHKYHTVKYFRLANIFEPIIATVHN